MIEGAGVLTLDETNAAAGLELPGANTYSGGTTLENGVLTVDASSATNGNGGTTSSSIGTGALTLEGGVLQAGADVSLTNAVTLAGGDTGTLDSDGHTLTLSGVIANTGALAVEDTVGGGVVEVSGANTYSGGTTLENRAVLRVDSNTALGTGDVTVNAFSYGATLQAGASVALANTVNLDESALTLDADGHTLTLNGVISQSSEGYVTVEDSSGSDGVVALAAAETYTGDTFIESGTLELSGAGSIAASSVEFARGATLDISAATGGESVRGISEDSSRLLTTDTTAIHLGANTLTIGDASTFAGVIDDGGVQPGAGGGGLTIGVANTAGSLTLEGANTYTGATTITSGSSLVLEDHAVYNNASGDYQLVGSGAIDDTSSVADGGTLVFSHYDSPGVATDFAPLITGAGSVVQDGVDTLTLTDTANSFTGGVTLHSGGFALTAVGEAGHTTGGGGGTITFAGSAALQVAQAAFAMAGTTSTLSNEMAGFGAHDVIDLTGLAFGAASTGSFAAGANGAPGTFTASNGASTDVIHMTTSGTGGLYVSGDGHGGTAVFGSLGDVITAADAATSGHITVQMLGNETLQSQMEAINIHAGVTLTIDGGGHTLDGDDNQYQGLFVYGGTVTVNDLTIADAAAIGGAGGSAGLGGGGAGLGGGLFVGSDTADGAQPSVVTLSGLNFQNDHAAGGVGGAAGSASQTGGYGGGGGGGLGGIGGVGEYSGGGGGGGIHGAGASDGSGSGGTVSGAAGGGASSNYTSTPSSGGASGGGGGGAYSNGHGGGGGVGGGTATGGYGGHGGYGDGGGGGGSYSYGGGGGSAAAVAVGTHRERLAGSAAAAVVAVIAAATAASVRAPAAAD